MKIKVQIKHFKTQKCSGKDFIDSFFKENDKYYLSWSLTSKMLNKSFFLIESKKIVERKYFFIIHFYRTLYYYRN